MNSSEAVARDLTAVQLKKGYGGRHANERLSMRQMVLPTKILPTEMAQGITRSKVNQHFAGALDTQYEERDGMTTITMLFQTETAAMKFDQELYSMALWGQKEKQ